ncbi:SDR family oxidoreductase [Sorangium atrum]|uniref:SDR family oxidoreductase n=1 Tax=Sorangium atrum TaxID=2995308 RepID=A0ABT5C5J8_9BACT|nr:SDR family oxidoreductase [Sorangium aterium]MDC0681228.1 SDR family oxidoreductase [Sorangium aterium]
MKEAHLVTGATGFIGGALVLELLRRTDDDIVAMVRPGDTGAVERFRQSIHHAASLYEATDVLAKLDRCRVVAGDVVEQDCGIREPIGDRVAQVWHVAASLQYENRHVDVIRATNVEGTRRVLALAGQLGAGTFNYISTAYVAGRATGAIPEVRSRGNATNNHYEQSKIDAETLVASWANGRIRIFRPSIVVGHSRTLGATSFSGCYGFFRQLVQFRGMIERTQKGLLSRSPVRMRVDPDGDLNLVPVDAVVQEAVGIALQDACEGVFHLTHPFPWKTGATVRAMFELLGMHAPIFINRRDDFSWLDQQLDKRMDFYGSYIIGHKHFERIRTDAALRGHERFAYAEVPLVALCQWYLEILEATRKNLPVAR